MQAENTVAMTLKSRPLFPLPQAVTLGAAIVAAAVFVSAQYGNWSLPQQGEKSSAASAPVNHPLGALVPFTLEPPPSSARAPQAVTAQAPQARTTVASSPWAITRGPLLDI